MREALAPRSEGAAPSAASEPGRRPVIASVEGASARSRPTRSSSRSAGSATGSSPRRRSSPARRPGSRLKLHTYHLVREDQQALYGFRTAEELGFFALLLTVNGVGPKVALAIVGSRPTADLQLAIMQQDQAVLVSIPGIGKKLAERIIFELKEKVAAAGVAARLGGRRRRARARARSSRRCRRSATRWPRPARRRGRPSPSPARRRALEDRVKAALRTSSDDA